MGIISKKVMILLGALLLSLAVTGSLFAYTYTVRSTTITANAATADFASVTTNSTPTPYNIVGSAKGSIGAATLFDIQGAAGYTGDVEVQVSLANVDQLVKDYSFWILRLSLTDNTTTTKVDMEGITKVLSLNTPFVSFAVDSANITGKFVYLRCEGGSFRALPFVFGNSAGDDPLIFCEVVQASPY